MSDEHVAEIRAKYGRPGVSGRKRKRFASLNDSESDVTAGTKTKRFKVCVSTIQNHMLA